SWFAPDMVRLRSKCWFREGEGQPRGANGVPSALSPGYPPPHGSDHTARSARFRRHLAPGSLVDPAARRLPRPLDVRRLLDLGGVPGKALHVRPVSVAVLFARDLRRLAARLVRPEAFDLAVVAAVLAGVPHPLGARRVPADLLLLPRRLLQGVLGR